MTVLGGQQFVYQRLDSGLDLVSDWSNRVHSFAGRIVEFPVLTQITVCGPQAGVLFGIDLCIVSGFNLFPHLFLRNGTLAFATRWRSCRGR